MIEMVDNSWGVHRRWSLNRYNNRFPWEVGEVGELVESTFSYHQNKYTRHQKSVAFAFIYCSDGFIDFFFENLCL